MVPTTELRWAIVPVKVPSTFEGGPGVVENKKVLQQLWMDPSNRWEREWRDVPECNVKPDDGG